MAKTTPLNFAGSYRDNKLLTKKPQYISRNGSFFRVSCAGLGNFIKFPLLAHIKI